MKFVIVLALVLLCVAVPQCSACRKTEIDSVSSPILAVVKIILEKNTELREKNNHAGDKIEVELDDLVHTMKPGFESKVNVLKNQDAQVQVAQSIKSKITNLVDNFDTIAEENKAIVKQLLHRFVDRLFGLVAPAEKPSIIETIFAAIVSILEKNTELREKNNHAGDKIKTELDDLLDSMKPRFESMVNVLKNAPIGADVKNMVETIKSTLNNLVDNFDTIAEENKAIVKQLLHRFVDRLFGLVAPEAPEEKDFEEKFLEYTIKPMFVGAAISILEKNPELIEKNSHAGDKIKAELDDLADSMKPRFESMIKVLKNGPVGADVKNMVESIKSTMTNLVDNHDTIAEENKAIVKQLLHRFVDRLFDL